MAAQALTVRTNDGIAWYCERRGSGPDIILVPSGEGDCSSFEATAAILSSSFTVTTFDMPGMSRTLAPRECYRNVTANLLAQQIVGLMDKLSINTATFFGSSSGGAAVLAILVNHPSRIVRAIIHEIPINATRMAHLVTLPDAELLQTCQHIFAVVMNEDADAWNDLGANYHTRLENNYLVWARNYIETFAPGVNSLVQDLKEKPVTWSVGAMTAVGTVISNVKAAYDNGIELDLLPCKHFPHVSIPEHLAEYILASHNIEAVAETC